MSDQLLIYSLDACDTVLNEARRLFACQRFPVGASVIAAAQTAGRGQHGHAWSSPAGNLYAAIRLPLTAPFTDFRGPMTVSAVIADVLADFDFDVHIKWPNDLVISAPQKGFAKCAGILLERKGELLAAGIGINLASAPSAAALREGAALPAGSLADLGVRTPSAPELWNAIARRFAAFDAEAFTKRWPAPVESRLLWQGKSVTLARDDAPPVTGVLTGLGPQGEALLLDARSLQSFTEGSLRPAF